MEFNYSLNIK